MTVSLLQPKLPASISAAESAELAARLAALANSGLPLEGGLRALAEEVARPRLAGVLRALAARLEKGEKLENAIAAPGSRLPVVLRGLIVAGLQSGRLPEVLDQFTLLTRRQHDLRRRVLATFAYPVLLLGIIAAMLILCRQFVAEEFLHIFHDFGTQLPDITLLYFQYSGLVGWLIVAVGLVVALAPPIAVFLSRGSWIGRVLFWIPFIGPIVRHERYVQFARLMATLLDAQVPLPDALNLAAIGMQGTLLEQQCRTACTAVEAGESLEEAFTGAELLESLICFVNWAQRRGDLAGAFRSAAEIFEARAGSQAALLNMIVLPLAYLFIVTYIGLTILALFLPFFSLVYNLSGGSMK